MRWYQNRRNYQNLSKGISVHRSEVSSKSKDYSNNCLFCWHININTAYFSADIDILFCGWRLENANSSNRLYNRSLYCAFTDERTWRPIWNSIQMGVIATLGNIIFGVAAAYAMVRLNFKGKTLLDILIMVPWALPGTVVAVNLIAAFSTESIFSFNQVLIGTYWILPLAYFIRHLPLVFDQHPPLLYS